MRNHHLADSVLQPFKKTTGLPVFSLKSAALLKSSLFKGDGAIFDQIQNGLGNREFVSNVRLLNFLIDSSISSKARATIALAFLFVLIFFFSLPTDAISRTC